MEERIKKAILESIAILRSVGPLYLRSRKNELTTYEPIPGLDREALRHLPIEILITSFVNNFISNKCKVPEGNLSERIAAVRAKFPEMSRSNDIIDRFIRSWYSEMVDHTSNFGVYEGQENKLQFDFELFEAILAKTPRDAPWE